MRATKGDEAAVPFLERAIERDPDFALAHAKLSVVMGNRGQVDQARTHAERSYNFV